ncbi:hypothetical protein DPMN_030008 [Dreissena polymorpha]|uniref:Uncharacterized protein n=1 Tax=Dreissena polymorpha TaxID=45954 RepID=A0A9D4LXF4_DREPO|nr:hypothetical protein DPMN_030008 [Dreissena polymorpha]
MKRTSRPKKGTHSACTCCSGQKQAHKRKNNDAPTSTKGKGPKKQKTHNILPLEANLDDDVNDNFSSYEETSVRLPAAPSTATTLGVQTSSSASPHMPGVPPHLPVESDSSSDSDSDEDDHYLFPSLQQAVSQHTNSLAGNGIQFAEPIGTPIINQIKSKTRKLIWKNKFVDMAFLLPSSQNPSTPQFTLQLDDQHNFTINPTSRSKKINTIEAWTTAFIRFMAVYLHKYP